MSSVTVRAPARLHLGLLDMSGVTGRRYGGSGLVISQPETVVDVSDAPEVDIDWATTPLTRDRSDVEDLVRYLAAARGLRFRVTVRQTPPAHVGFGSKTTLLLSILAGISAALSLDPPMILEAERVGE